MSFAVHAVVQPLSRVWLFANPWAAPCQACLSFTVSWSSLRFMSIESVMPSDHLLLCRPLLLLPSIFPSVRVFSNELALCISWPTYWSFSFSISPSNDYSGLISFRMDWFDLLAVQKTIKRLLQHHSSKSSTLWHSAFFMVQLLHPYVTTGKTMAFTSVVHWRQEWQTTSVSLLRAPQESMKRQKDMTPNDEPPRLVDGFHDPRLSP